MGQAVHQDEAMAVAGVVIESGRIRQPQRQRGIGDAPGVPAPYVGIRNEMAAARRPVPYASDTSFRAVQRNKQQVDLIPAGFGLADQVHPVAAGKSRLHCKTHSPIEILRRPFQDFPSGGDGRGGWIQRIQTAGYRIGIQQPLAAFEIGGSRERGLSRPVRPCDYREGGHAASGRMRRQFPNDLVVLSGRRARNPADFEPSAIGALHSVETVGVAIEDRKPGRKRFEEGLVARGPHRLVELLAGEIVGYRHT